METLISIFREVRDPRDFNARHDLAAMLFIALAAKMCGAKSCVDIADFAAAHESDLAEIVDLQHGVPSHDSFSRLFRLLDPEELAAAFARFVTALREGLGLGPVKGVVAVDGKRLRLASATKPNIGLPASDAYISASTRCTKWTEIDPSPTADATRFTLPARASPTANTPGKLVSSK